MRVGLFTEALADVPLEDALGWLSATLPEVRDVEIGTGGYSDAPHCDLASLLESEAERRRWLRGIEESGFRLAALNASGNPLEYRAHDRALRGAIELAGSLGVDRVVCMSGGDPRLSGGGWLPGLEECLERDWEERVLPYWGELSRRAGAAHEGLRLCLELEPGAAVYNVSTFERVVEVGPNVAVNLDPSHLFWQGIDPLAVIVRLGGRVAFVHGKDTVVDAERVRLDGMLDRTAWTYATVGRGHDPDWWTEFAAALSAAGYDGVVSIEHEDPLVEPRDGIVEAARVLASVTLETAA